MLAGQFDPQKARNAEMLLLRIHLGLNPLHSVLHAVRVLHDEGRAAFEEMRGPRCAYAHEWKPPVTCTDLEEFARFVAFAPDDSVSDGVRKRALAVLGLQKYGRE